MHITKKCTVAVYDGTPRLVVRHVYRSTTILLWKQPYSYNSQAQHLALESIPISLYFLRCYVCMVVGRHPNIVQALVVSFCRILSIMHQQDTIDEYYIIIWHMYSYLYAGSDMRFPPRDFWVTVLPGLLRRVVW